MRPGLWKAHLHRHGCKTLLWMSLSHSKAFLIGSLTFFHLPTFSGCRSWRIATHQGERPEGMLLLIIFASLSDFSLLLCKSCYYFLFFPHSSSNLYGRLNQKNINKIRFRLWRGLLTMALTLPLSLLLWPSRQNKSLAHSKWALYIKLQNVQYVFRLHVLTIRFSSLCWAVCKSSAQNFHWHCPKCCLLYGELIIVTTNYPWMNSGASQRLNKG